MNPNDAKHSQAFRRLLQIMNDLREKCPWDKKQTIESLSYLTIEEVYELTDAIGEKDLQGIKEELGDLMLHIAFYSKIGDEQNAFDMGDVLNTVCEKLIRRHPHIYGDVKTTDEEEIKRNWERIKLEEKATKKEKKSVLSGVPKSLPALIKAIRIQEKARGIGFDWDDTAQVLAKVEEEMKELNEAIAQKEGQDRIEEEFGDLLFALINYGRFIDVNPETALEKCNKKFIRRFNFIEESAEKNGQVLANMTLAEMEEYWQEAKKIEKKV
jgi:XTP/dITP diphosphohydrolase